MSQLKEIKKPSVALIKLVEAIGIILEIKPSYEKSHYKAPMPSNYDSTVELLSTNFEEIFQRLICLRSCDIRNDIARELYTKMEEPGFNYEDVVNQGGLESRELFNSIVFNLNQLQADINRIPLANTNIFVAVNGSRSSYVALDAAAHVHSHGVLTIGAITAGDSGLRGQRDLIAHLGADIERRSKRQYTKSSYLYNIKNISVNTTDMIVSAVEEEVVSQDCGIVLVGVETNSSVISGLEDLATWAVKRCEGRIVVLAKSCCRVLPFGETNMSRKFQVCVKHLDELPYAYRQCLTLMRPGDSIVVVTILDPVQLKLDAAASMDPDAAKAKETSAAANHVQYGTRFNAGRKPGMWVSEHYHPSLRAAPAEEAQEELLNTGLADEKAEVGSSASRASSPPATTGTGRLYSEPMSIVKAVSLEFETAMQALIGESQVTGKVRIEQFGSVPKTGGRIICEIAHEESADFLVLRRGKHARNLSLECVKDCMCAVALID
jgi:hypothetical protein